MVMGDQVPLLRLLLFVKSEEPIKGSRANRLILNHTGWTRQRAMKRFSLGNRKENPRSFLALLCRQLF